MNIKIRHQINLANSTITITIFRDKDIWDSLEFSLVVGSRAPEYTSTVRSVLMMLETDYTEEVIYIES